MPSEEYLALKTRLGKKSVSRVKARLCDRGILSWISPKQSSVKNRSCIYTINEKELGKYIPDSGPATLGVGHSDPYVTEEGGTEAIFTAIYPIKILLIESQWGLGLKSLEVTGLKSRH